MYHQALQLGAFFALLSGLLGTAVADQLLHTSGFSTCQTSSDINVNVVDVTYDASAKKVTFDVAGASSKVMNVTAELSVTAYGKSVYSNSFNPCDGNTFVDSLCPVPEGDFSARGKQSISDKYASMIPSIAFSVPDIAAQATLILNEASSNNDVACIQSSITNGKTINVPAISYVAGSVAGMALLVSAASAALGGSGAPAGHISPSFTEVFGWFQGMAMNGMLSVKYPEVYRSFTKNFAFSTGLVSWTHMQSSIDSFRDVTGANLTENNVEFLLHNASLTFGDDSTSKIRRGLGLVIRDDSSSNTTKVQQTVTGIKAFSEQLMVPASNTFMTVLLIAAIVVASIIVGILAFKVILETWALFASFPRRLIGFRKHYWGTIGRTIVQLILVLYGIWVLYCVFQFTHGDSWAAQTLAAVTLTLFTAILAFFTFRIWQMAHRLRKIDGDASGLYNDKKTWFKYSIFYETYKQEYWWLFIPIILYMFAKGCVLAAGEGHGLSQTIAQLIVESLMLALLIWKRPFERRSGNVINIVIQVVRALSVICILVFVEQLGIQEFSQTVAGIVLIVVQSVLTAALGILILVNAIILLVKQNPHRKRRKAAEKERDLITPLTAHDSLLLEPSKMNAAADFEYKIPQPTDSKFESTMTANRSFTPLQTLRAHSRTPTQSTHRSMRSSASREQLLHSAAPISFDHSPPRDAPLRGPTPGGDYRGVAY